jgi:hypothetical protein
MDHHNALIRREAPLGFSDCLRIAVDREQAPCVWKSLEYPRRVTAAAEGRVDIQATVRVVLRGFVEAERNERFFDKHRCVLIQFCRPRNALI